MPPENMRLAVDDASLKSDVDGFIQFYEDENRVRLTGAQALRLLIRAGIGTMRGEQTARRMQDKQNRGKLRK